jgi:hypothetical protein
VLDALCPLGTGRARLETSRSPEGGLPPGAFIVARSVPLGPHRWALLGRAPVVPREVVADFDALLATLEAPRGEFWRVHGGVLARAAWAWPEERRHTIDGELVRHSLVAIELRELDGALAALDRDGELEPDLLDEASVPGWRWRWDPPAPRPPAAEPGVRLELCPEDADPRPALARVEVDLEARELWLFAPTPGRLALAEQLLRDRLGAAVGEVKARDVDWPEVMPRWRRLRWERALDRLAPSLRRLRRAAA